LHMTDTPTEPTTALIVRPRVLPTMAQFAIEQQMAWKLRNARGFLPNHFMTGDDNERAAKILAAIEYARAVGIEPMIALQNTQVIDGKVGASALLIGALLRKADYGITDDTNDVRSIVTVSKNGISVKGEFSMQDAARAKLIKDGSGWQKYPRDMMYARALTQAARRGAQDAVLGMAYTAEELGGIEEEIAGVPVIEGEVIDAKQEAVAQTTGVQASPSPASAEVLTVGNAAPTVAPVGPTLPDQAAPDAPAPPQTAQKRSARSVGPQAKRTNVVTVPQGAEKPATAPEVPTQTTVTAEVVSSQPAPSALTDEPILAEPVDDGHAVYVAQQRELLRQSAATLNRVNVLLRNQAHALKGEDPEEVPGKAPDQTSDAAVSALIERDYPGRTLANADEGILQNRLELVEANLASKRGAMKERGISEE
jgi:hypothetical protein